MDVVIKRIFKCQDIHIEIGFHCVSKLLWYLKMLKTKFKSLTSLANIFE